MSRGRTLTGALLATLAMPSTWPLALGAFLIRGGIVLVALPIVVLPTPVGVGNVVAPGLTSIAFGSVPVELIVVAAATGIGVMVWLVGGGWVAAALEAEAAWIVATADEIAGLDEPAGTVVEGAADRPTTVALPQDGGHVAGRILAARLIAYLPLAIVLAAGSVRLVFVTYRELTVPIEVATPIALRVLRAAPEVVIAVVLAWMVGEIIGAMAARRIALGGAGVGVALRDAVAMSVRRPLASIVRFWLPTLVLVLVLAPAALAAAKAWETVGSVLGGGSDALEILVTVVMFVGLWIVGLLLLSVVCAWRAAVWTVAEVTREGTFGGSSHRRPGHWQHDPSSASL